MDSPPGKGTCNEPKQKASWSATGKAIGVGIVQTFWIPALPPCALWAGRAAVGDPVFVFLGSVLLRSDSFHLSSPLFLECEYLPSNRILEIFNLLFETLGEGIIVLLVVYRLVLSCEAEFMSLLSSFRD